MSKTINNQVALFKKDNDLLEPYISSVFDSTKLKANRDLNIFTSQPNDFKEAVLSSLKNSNSNGALFGIPIVVKDNFNTTIFPTTGGTPALENSFLKEDAPVIKTIKNAGAIIIGKTNLHELAFGITSNNSHFGAVKNPHNPLYFAGGSSGGTAVAVAKDIVAVGLGTDTGGSCRIPAALCGVYGFRPTSGIYSSEGVVPLSSSRDTPGTIANSVENIIILDEVITDKKNTETPNIKTLRIGIPKAYFYDDLSPDVDRVSEETIQKLKKNGITLIEVDIKGIPELLTESINIVLHETYVELHNYLSTYTPSISFETLANKVASPDVKGLFDAGAIAKNPNYSNALKEREDLQKAYQNYFLENKLDAILYPTTPLEAMPIIGSDETVSLNGKQVPTFPTYIRNMNPGSYAGVPGITIPAGKSKLGLPIGIHLEAPKNNDKKLLKIAKLIENILLKN